MTQSIELLSAHAAPAGRPQPMTFHDGALWVGCWDTSRLYALDPKTFAEVGQVALPGIPYGIASFDGALRVVVSIGDDDDRFIYRVRPGQDLTEEGRIECPELSGSHLTTNGKSLYLVQQGLRRLLALDAAGGSVKTIPLPTRCAGIAFEGAAIRVIAADDEFDVLEFAALDLGETAPEVERLAPMPVEARGLAFDGETWWTAFRERNEIVSFAVTATAARDAGTH